MKSLKKDEFNQWLSVSSIALVAEVGREWRQEEDGGSWNW
jgi:hypothetical protein